MPSITGFISASFIEVEGQTHLRDRAHAYPLKLAKAFPLGHGQLGVYVMDASPGIMSGDRYELDWQFGERTHVFVTNQSYTKVHPIRNDTEGAVSRSEQKQTLRLMQDCFVEYMPEPLMLYKDAVFYSSTEVWMEPGAALMMTDIVCPGRTQRGEIFQYQLYQNKLSVLYGQELIYCGKQRIEPEVQNLQGIGSWESFTHSGSLYVFYDRIDMDIVDKLRDFVDADQNQQAAKLDLPIHPLYYGVSRTYKNGFILSVMGNKVYEIQRLLEACWHFIRLELFAKPPLHVRK